MPTISDYSTFRRSIAQDPTTIATLLEECLDKIAIGKSYNAFVRVYAAEARKRAKELATAVQHQAMRPLTGMMVGLKDLFCYKNHPVQASSKILSGFISQIAATAVARLIDAGAIILGHQNSDEFGMGSANENSVYGPVNNPIDPNRTPGGSSGGSAAAVAAGMCHVALGTDTGGSVRQPAALCGLVGLKPTYSRISRYGVVAYSSSFDTVGILASSVEDCSRVLQVISGHDPKDNTSATCKVPDYLDKLPWQGKKVKIGYLKETLEDPGLQPAIKRATLAILDQLKNAGHIVRCVDFPLLPYALPTYYVLTTAEACANLARYDGVRYGFRAKNAPSFEEMITKTRTQGFGKEVKRRLLLGAFVSRSNYYDTYYNKAQKVRRKIQQSMHAMLEQYDYILCPTTPTTAFPHNSTLQDPVTQYLADLYTVPASVAGLPAISIPNGCDENGLPIGLQIITKPFLEATLLSFATHLLDTFIAKA